MSGVRVANFFGTTGELQLLNQTIMWPGGTTEIPIGRPACGFDNEFCKVDAKEKKLLRQALLAQTWKVKYEDIKWPKNKGKLGSRKSMHLPDESCSTLDSKPNMSLSGLIRSCDSDVTRLIAVDCAVKLVQSMAGSERGSMDDIRGQIFTVLGTYEGNMVAVKKIQKAKVVLERDVLLELKEDVLHNDNLKLDWMFQMSISSDIARSLACKVADHGLFLFKEGQDIDLEAGADAKAVVERVQKVETPIAFRLSALQLRGALVMGFKYFSDVEMMKQWLDQATR
ncbi:hypothetical protein OS493_040571, partial [Desmophyllum pertusum]